MDTIDEQPLDPRRRELHPERISIADEIFVRNDIQARELGISERSVNRDDRRGAPFMFIGGVKYRPKRRYELFLLDSIQTRAPQPRKQSHKRKVRRRT